MESEPSFDDALQLAEEGLSYDEGARKEFSGMGKRKREAMRFVLKASSRYRKGVC